MRATLRGKTWTPDLVGQITHLWQTGRSAGEIATVMGLSRSTVSGKLNRLGLHRNHKPPTAKPKILKVPKQPMPIDPLPLDTTSTSTGPSTDRMTPRQPKPELRAMLAKAVANTARK
jgi:GcrA cell cycle regulator